MNKKTAEKKFKVFSSRNYQIFALAIVVLVLGYISLAQGPADSKWSLVVAPLLLGLGYCVLIPVAIFWKAKRS